MGRALVFPLDVGEPRVLVRLRAGGDALSRLSLGLVISMFGCTPTPGRGAGLGSGARGPARTGSVGSVDARVLPWLASASPLKRRGGARIWRPVKLLPIVRVYYFFFATPALFRR